MTVETQKIFTERAHLMCPSMSFGIAATLSAACRFDKVRDCVTALERAHPFLRAVISWAGEQCFYDVRDCGMTAVEAWHSVPDMEELLRAYAQINRHDTDLSQEGLLKVFACGDAETTTLLFVFHHLLADGRGALGLVREFAELYVHGTAPQAVDERLIAPGDLPADCTLTGIGAWFIRRMNRKWAKEGHAVSYEAYHAWAEAFAQKDAVCYRCTQEPVDTLAAECRETGVSVNDYLMAKMFVEEKTGKIIIALDLRGELPCYRAGALGNYSPAFSILYRAKNTDVMTEAKQVHALVRKTAADHRASMQVLACYSEINPGLLDAAAISALDGFRSRSGAFVGARMFGFGAAAGYSITNLGRIDSDAIASAMFIPPVSPAIRKMQGVLTVNGQMCICTAERKMK